MSAQPSEHDTLKALRDRASAKQVEEAEIDAAIAEHEAWKAAGRFIVDQTGMMAVNRAVEALADDPAPPSRTATPTATDAACASSPPSPPHTAPSSPPTPRRRAASASRSASPPPAGRGARRPAS
jgi:hypothetical protein